MENKKKNIGILIAAILLPLIVGAISSLLTNDAMKQFHFFNKPPLSPPGWLFPIVWTILYILMGIASYYVYQNNPKTPERKHGLELYFVQLGLNFLWSLIFFNASEFLLAFIVLTVMWLMVLIATIFFFSVDKRAGFLMLPYLAWTTFAGYLNMGIYILSITPAIMHK